MFKKIDANDHYRALLTDTLPYETLFPFSNFYYHSYIKKNRLNDFPRKLSEILTSKKYTIPYSYEVSHKESSIRKLSIIHPGVQKRICEFYEDYGSIIIELCTKSEFSIRRPFKVANYYYEKRLKRENETPEIGTPVEADPLPYDQQQMYVSSYFCYRDFSLLHEFFESWKFLDCEKKYLFFSSVDVSKCFHSIYTHTISWAVKSKEFSKKYSLNKYCFESIFDKIMQHANYNETHGILVGPEASRIFSEIIFQEIDRNIIEELSGKSLEFKTDYRIYRYIDDYFIFANSHENIGIIHNVISERLLEYKLYINEKKSKLQSRPFISSQSKAKLACSKSINEFFSLDSTSKKSSKLIKQIQADISNAGASFPDVSRYMMTAITRKALISIKQEFDINDNKALDNYLSLIKSVYEMLFFIYSMDCNFRTTNLLGKFVLSVQRACQKLPDHAQDAVGKSLFDKATDHINNRFNQNKRLGIEEFNLLIILSQIRERYPVSLEKMNQWFSSNVDPDSIKATDYFGLVTLIYYIKDLQQYNSLLGAATKQIEVYLSVYFQQEKAHDILLLIDTISCPWVSEKVKKVILFNCLRRTYEKPSSVTEATLNKQTKILLNFITNRKTWFFDWSSQDYLEHVLEKKELRTPY